MREGRGAETECCLGGHREHVQIQGHVNHARKGVGKCLLGLASRWSCTTGVRIVLVACWGKHPCPYTQILCKTKED